MEMAQHSEIKHSTMSMQVVEMMHQPSASIRYSCSDRKEPNLKCDDLTKFCVKYHISESQICDNYFLYYSCLRFGWSNSNKISQNHNFI